MNDREKILQQIEALLKSNRNASYADFPDGATWADVSEVEDRLIARARAFDAATKGA